MSRINSTKAKIRAARITGRKARQTPFGNSRPSLKVERTMKADFEYKRQLFHMLFGGLLLITALFFGRENTMLLYAFGVGVGIAMLHLKLSGSKVPLVDDVLERFERKSAKFPGQGAIMYFAGALLALTFAPFDFALAIIAIVAVGDGFATLVGMKGKLVLSWNRKKTWEGFLAFMFSSAAIASLVLPFSTSLAYALALAAAETLELNSDDNMVLPITALALYHIIGLR
ncbi:hypothetical protein HZC09_06940 [Candidatus Micrarchaeota archaeon]|nr:hypothetical protein [Candidatus Micrarchaeota archaeon]